MAFTRGGAPVYSGEWNDADGENISNIMGVVDVAPSTARFNTGLRSNAFDLVGISKKALQVTGSLGSAGKLIMKQAFVGLSAAPASEMALVSAHGNYGASASFSGLNRHLRIGTDRKVRAYDKNGVQSGTASTTLIPIAGLQQITLALDGLTLSTVWISVAFGTSWELFFDTGLTWPQFFFNRTLYWGDAVDAATNRNVTLYIDDATYQESTDPLDVPHLTQYPDYRIASAASGDSNGVHVSWTNQAGAAASWIETDNSELPTHDAEATYWTTTASVRQLVKSSAANPLPVGATIGWVMQRTVGRSTDATKGPYHAAMRLGGVDLTTNMVYVPGTSYLGNYTLDCARPGGGAWVRADFDPNVLEWGVHSATGSVSLRCTLHLGPDIAYYTSLLPLAPTPTGAIAPEPNAPPQVEGGKGPLLRPDYNHAMRPTGLLRDIETIRRQTDRSIRGRRACGRSGSVAVRR